MRSRGTPIFSTQSRSDSGVIRVDARPETVGVEPEHLGRELPRVIDRAFFEVVADRPVAEHLEKRVMRRVADRRDVVVFQPRAAKAFLTRDEVARRWRALSGDPRFQRHHAGHGEEKRRIVVGNERESSRAGSARALRRSEEIAPGSQSCARAKVFDSKLSNSTRAPRLRTPCEGARLPRAAIVRRAFAKCRAALRPRFAAVVRQIAARGSCVRAA